MWRYYIESKRMRWKYKDGEMIWETPLCTYKVYPTKRDGEILYVLEYSDKEQELFYNRADAKGSAEADYENRVVNIKLL